MDAITGYLSAHPAVLVICAVIIVILFLQFTFKSMIKLVLIMFFILLAVLVITTSKIQVPCQRILWNP